jgi:tetratricopeptide (TPR) repeat protein
MLENFGLNDNKRFTINSKPQKAIVYKYQEKSKSFIKLGQTPLEIKGKEFDKLKNFSAYKIEKKGFVPEHLIYDKKTKTDLNYLVLLKPVETWSDVDAEVSSKLAGAIAKKVQKINIMVLKKKFDQALKLTQKLVEQYPKAHTFYDIKGSIYLLKGQKKQAIASLKKSLSLNAENPETEKLVQVLEAR